MKKRLEGLLLAKAIKKNTIFVIPSKQGMIFLGVFFTLFLSGLFYNNNLTLILAFMLMSYFIVELFYHHQDFAKIDLDDLYLRDARPALALTLREGRIAADIVLFTDQGRLVSGHEKRGQYRAYAVKLVSKGSSMFRFWKYKQLERDVFIYPRPVECPAILRELGQSLQTQSFDIPHQLKRFQLQDRSSMIYWKSLAKNHLPEHEFEKALMSKDFRNDDKNELKIRWDKLDADKDKSIRIAAWLINYCFQNQILWQLEDSFGKSEMAKNLAHWKESMEKLSVA